MVFLTETNKHCSLH